VEKPFEELTPEEQFIKSKESNELYNKFFNTHARLVWHIVNRIIQRDIVKYLDCSLTFDDFIQYGYIGMLKAYNTYDPTRSKWATWASACIRNEVLFALRKIRAPFRRRILTQPLDTILAENEKGEYASLTINKVVGYNDTNMELHETYELLNNVIEQIKPSLLETELRLIGLMLEDRDDMTQRDMSIELGVSQSYVSRLIKRINTKASKAREKMLVL